MLYTQNYCYMMIMSQVNAIARNFSSKIISAFTRCYCIKKLPARAGYVRHMGSIPQSGRSPGEGHGNPTPVFFPENPMNREAWQTTVYGVAKNQTWLNDLAPTYYRTQEYSLEKEVATHSSILAWKVPWMEDPSGLHPVGSQRVGHDWAANTPPH